MDVVGVHDVGERPTAEPVEGPGAADDRDLTPFVEPLDELVDGRALLAFRHHPPVADDVDVDGSALRVVALSVGVEEGKIKRGDLIVSEAIGGGLAWGAVVLRW